jgi:GMP synthase-like glutamine amidotransferase
MKILLINNHTQHLKGLQQSLAGHEVKVQVYRPGLQFHDQGKDLIILSGGGGEGLEIDDKIDQDRLWYEDEMEFVLRNQKPLIGICMGFEVICRAHGLAVPKMPKLLMAQAELKTTKRGQTLLGRSRLSQLEAHQWHVTEAPRGFEVLAESQTGIEIIKNGNIFATQFHPEKPGTLALNRVIAGRFI